MKKRYLVYFLFGCFFMLLSFAGCKNDMERTLEKIEKKGYTTEIRTKYSAEDVEEYRIMNIYSDGQEIELVQFNEDGSVAWYTLMEYNSDNQRTKDSDYNEADKLIGNVEYEYDVNGNMITKYIYEGEMEFIYHYQYDGQNRIISKAEDVGEGTTQAVFYVTNYFYDEEGRLDREEIFATGEPYAYIVYEYDGAKKVKKEKYLIGTSKDSYLEGTEYEYDDEGRLTKCIYYDEQHNCSGYMTYEYH